MNKLLKFIILLTLCTNAYILRAMADEKSDRSHVLKPTVFKSTRITTDTDTGESTQPPAKKREILSTAGTSAFRTFQRHAPTASGDSPISVMESTTDSSISPASSTMEDDMTKLLHVVLARAKEEFDHSHTHAIAGTPTSSSVASSSSACASVLILSMHPANYPSKRPNRIRANVVLIQPLPCLWPSEPPCHEIFGNLDDLLKHIYQYHINKDYEYDTKHCQCPYQICGCTTEWPARLMYHLFGHHHGLQPLRPWQCSICKKRSSNPEVLSRKKHTCKITEVSTENTTSEER